MGRQEDEDEENEEEAKDGEGMRGCVLCWPGKAMCSSEVCRSRTRAAALARGAAANTTCAEDSTASLEGSKQDKEDKAAAYSSAGDKYRITLIDISGLENWSNPAAAPRSVNRKSNGSRESETKA